MAVPAAETNDGKLNHLVAVQLQKTKMCAMHQRGTCRDPKCRFAHSPDELRAAPNLSKTAICRMYTRGQCHNNGCKFAHGEQELRVTPSVYKTQLCNFHMRGHCKKGNRCRHAHGDEELRSFLSKAANMSSPPSPSLSEDTQSTAATDSSPYCGSGYAADEVGVTYDNMLESAIDRQALIASPFAAHWAPMGAFPEMWPGSPQSPMSYSPMDSQLPHAEWWATPPPSTNEGLGLSRAATATPEKLVPAFPGVQRTGSPSNANSLAEPMKIALPSSCAPGRVPSPVPSPEDVGALAARHAAQMAMAAQAHMEYELAAAQLKVQQLQVQRQMYTAARFAVTAPLSGHVVGAPDGHFESIMQTLQGTPSRPATPCSPLTPTPPPPGLEGIQGPADISQQRGTAWVI